MFSPIRLQRPYVSVDTVVAHIAPYFSTLKSVTVVRGVRLFCSVKSATGTCGFNVY